MGKAVSTSRALAPFQIRSFRFQWPGDLAASWAFEMETLILGWYILTETGSVLLLVLFGALQYLGSLFSPMFGVVTDRIGHRKLLCITRAVYAVLGATLMVLAFSSQINPVAVFILTTLGGVIKPSDLMMRNALIGATMPTEHLMSALSLSRTTTDSARITGALTGAGLVAALGMGPAYVAVTCFYALSFALTLGVAGGRPRPAATDATASSASPSLVRTSSWHDLRSAFGYVWHTPELLAGISLAFLVNLTAYPWCLGLLPYVAKDVYGVGQPGLGALVASFALGGLLGSLTMSVYRIRVRPARMMIVFSVTWHLMILAFGHTSSIISGMVLLVFAGLSQNLCVTPLAVSLLNHSSAAYRGRVMGVRILAIWGLPLGLLLTGPLIGQLGFAPTATLYSVIGLAFTVLIALHWRPGAKEAA